MCIHLVLWLVLYKEHRVHSLAYIVEERADARLQCICTDGLGSLLGQVRDL